jgi:hypothetical protein
MAKRDMKKALGASLKAEEQAVSSRFEKSATAPRGRPAPGETGGADGDRLGVRVADAELISRVRRRCMKAGIDAGEEEVLRAGLAALDGMADGKLASLFRSVRRAEAGGGGRENPSFVVRRAYAVGLPGASQGAPPRPGRRVFVIYRSS